MHVSPYLRLSWWFITSLFCFNRRKFWKKKKNIGSTIQNRHINGNNFELDPEYNEFRDFHKFAAIENMEPICVISDVCDIKNSAEESTDTDLYRQSDVDQVLNVSTDDNSTLEPDNQKQDWL